MAKQAKTAIKAKGSIDPNAKAYTKVIKCERSPKSGAYVFKEAMVHKDNLADHLKG
ncbi:MAG: hypothetical protein RL138_1096 [Bacteroidota bacterium]|jgi:hypothetical protein|nr:DUF4295 family protein [Chitinophagales bacterium]